MVLFDRNVIDNDDDDNDDDDNDDDDNDDDNDRYCSNKVYGQSYKGSTILNNDSRRAAALV